MATSASSSTTGNVPESDLLTLEPFKIDVEDRARLKRLYRLRSQLIKNNLLETVRERFLNAAGNALRVEEKTEEKRRTIKVEALEELREEEQVHEGVDESKDEFGGAPEIEAIDVKESFVEEDFEDQKKELDKAELDLEGETSDNGTTKSQRVCEICGQQFSDLRSLLRHQDGYHGIPGTAVHRGSNVVFKCNFCELEFPARSQLLRHCTRIHSEEMDDNQQSTVSRVSKHSNDHKNQPKICLQCDLRFDGIEQLLPHLEQVHPGLFCDICYKLLHDASLVALHRRVHFAENPFACDLCPRVFKNLQHVGEHRRGHTGEKPYACSECPQRFARSGDLGKHRKHRHMAEPSFLCTNCPAKFHSSALFYRHRRKHQEAPELDDGSAQMLLDTFSCEKCGVTFADGNERKEHVLLNHSEGRPFGCDTCGKRFKLSGHLKAHALTHTGIKGHKCDQCPAAYYLAGDLRRHQKTHQNQDRW